MVLKGFEVPNYSQPQGVRMSPRNGRPTSGLPGAGSRQMGTQVEEEGVGSMASASRALEQMSPLESLAGAGHSAVSIIEGLLCVSNGLGAGGPVRDAALCLEEFADWWGSDRKDRKTGVSADGSGAPPITLRASFHLGPEGKERQPERKFHPVILGQAVSPALEKKLSEGRMC